METMELPPRTFDWKSRHDIRSLNYAVSDVVPIRPDIRKKMWGTGDVLDQGAEGACVGFGWSGELAAAPVRIPQIDNRFALGMYQRAKTLDEWPGEDYEGTSVLAGAKACQQLKLIGEYRWSFSIEDLRDALIHIGPVVIGIPWMDGMYQTRPSGLVDVSGRVVGGHCILLTGYNPKMRISGEGFFKRWEVARWRNSWGTSYGKKGDGWIQMEDLERLLQNSGEACVPMQRFKIQSIRKEEE
jgi:hypothetical protein